jgi:Uma2 family endonuclease
MGNLERRDMTAREFVVWEAEQDERYEFVDGEVSAMTGGTYAHDRTRTNLSAALLQHLRGTPCRIIGPDIRLRVDAETPGYYPDLFVVCRNVDSQTAELNEAKLVIEVISPTTEKKDRGAKWENYQRLATLEEYVLIDPGKQRIEIYRRLDTRDWRLHICSAEETIRFESIDFSIAFDAVFEDLS